MFTCSVLLLIEIVVSLFLPAFAFIVASFLSSLFFFFFFFFFFLSLFFFLSFFPLPFPSLPFFPSQLTNMGKDPLHGCTEAKYDISNLEYYRLASLALASTSYRLAPPEASRPVIWSSLQPVSAPSPRLRTTQSLVTSSSGPDLPRRSSMAADRQCHLSSSRRPPRVFDHRLLLDGLAESRNRRCVMH